MGSIKSIRPWCMAALSSLKAKKTDLADHLLEPNNALCSRIHRTITEWRLNRTVARDVGIVDKRPAVLFRPPQQDCRRLVRMWLRFEINKIRAEKLVPVLDEKWAENLAGVQVDNFWFLLFFPRGV